MPNCDWSGSSEMQVTDLFIDPPKKPPVVMPSPEEIDPDVAIEVILKGEPWKECPTCLGCGLRFTQLEKVEGGWNITQLDCEGCNGNGWVIRAIYGAALRALGKEPPTKSPGTIMRSVAISEDGTNTYT